MRLGRNQICPLHRKRTCCGREDLRPARAQRKYEQVAPGVRRIPDEHHPRGYRELRSKSAMKRLLDKKIIEQNKLCGICHEPMDDYQNVAPDHVEPRGSGGSRRDDHESNIQAVHHFPCNVNKGSSRITNQ